MFSHSKAALSLLRRLARDERGRVGLGVAAGLVVVAALAGLIFNMSAVMAHHPEYSASADCYGWDADAGYVGGSSRKAILIENVVINGAAYQPSWSNSSADPPPNDSGDGGYPLGTNRVIPFNDYTGPKKGLEAVDGVNDYFWVGTDGGWTVFDLDEVDLGPLDTGPGKWGGSIKQYHFQVSGSGNFWQLDQGVNVYAPTAPTNCSRIIIDKVTDPRHDPQSFDFSLSKSGFTTRNFSLTDDSPPWNSGVIPAGTYNAAETVPSGWQKTGATCSDGSPVNAISLQLGETVTCTFNNAEKGRIIVRKVTMGGDGTFTFDTNYKPDFTLSNGQQNDSGLLAPGTYSVTETGIPAGWNLLSAACDDGSNPSSIGLSAGETVTCTFTNVKKGKIIVRKVTVGGDASFTFDPSYGPDFNLSNGQQNDSGLLAPGTYSVAETGIPAGWALTSAVCDDGSDPSAIGLGAGETVTCTFTNTKAGRIIVRKVTVGGDASFTFDPSYGPDFNLSNGQQNDSGSLAPGTYSVAETGIPAGWALTSAVCDDGSDPGSIGLSAGETVTCTFTNTKAGRIIVRKVTVGGDASFTFDTNYGSDFNLSNGQQNDSGPLAPGTYSVAEAGIPAGWSLTSAVCDDGSTPNSIGLAAGETVTCTFTNTKKGNIIVRKVTVGGDASFTFDPSYGPDFNLSNGQQNDSGPLAPGTYSVAETGIPAGWDLTSAVCDDGSAPGSIGLAAGETVTCTFTNTKRGHIIVRKVTVGGDASFTFDTSYGPDFNLSNGQQNDSGPLVAGTYSVAEAGIPAGWDLTSAVCDDGSAPGSIGLAAGETVTCTFTNTMRGRIIIDKVTNPAADPQSFDFTLVGGPSALNQAFSLTDAAAPHDSGAVLPGSGYSAAEAAPPADWVLTGATCSDGSPIANIDVAPGETVTCTFTNTKPPKLIVIKHVINDNGGTAVAADFTMTVTANNPNPASFPGVEAPGTLVALDAGAYAVNEAGPSGYSAIFSAECGGFIEIGQTKTCTVTNDDIGPRLIVIKHVINDDGGTAVAADFTMNVTANSPNPASFAGVEAPGTTVLLNVGAYSVDETGPSGYAASFSADCTGTVTIADVKTCTVTNDDVPRGSIIVEKQTIPGGAVGNFDFTGTAAGTISDNGQIVVTNLVPGTYTSAEVDLPAGFSLSSIVCDDANSANPSSGSVASATATFELDADEVVKCTFTNRLESTPTPTPSPTPTSTPTETPTSTPTTTPSPTPTVTETPPATVPPVVAPETLTPKPTQTASPTATTRPPDATPATPSVLPPSGRGAISDWAAWPWLALLAAGGLVMMLSLGVVWSTKERRGQ